MKLSTKERHAISAMIELAIHEPYGLVTLTEISRTQGISISYLEQLFAKLRKHGLVEGLRGPGGGYRLGKPKALISVADIILALDGNQKRGPTGHEAPPSEMLWQELSHQIQDFLSDITLAQIVERPAIQAMLQQRTGGVRHHPARRHSDAA